jgi:hypothetical protein
MFEQQWDEQGNLHGHDLGLIALTIEIVHTKPTPPAEAEGVG